MDVHPKSIDPHVERRMAQGDAHLDASREGEPNNAGREERGRITGEDPRQVELDAMVARKAAARGSPVPNGGSEDVPDGSDVLLSVPVPGTRPIHVQIPRQVTWIIAVIVIAAFVLGTRLSFQLGSFITAMEKDGEVRALFMQQLKSEMEADRRLREVERRNAEELSKNVKDVAISIQQLASRIEKQQLDMLRQLGVVTTEVQRLREDRKRNGDPGKNERR